jgi:hypothetical protein
MEGSHSGYCTDLESRKACKKRLKGSSPLPSAKFIRRVKAGIILVVGNYLGKIARKQREFDSRCQL